MINLSKDISPGIIPTAFNDQLREHRAKGLARYSESGLPGNKIEHWMKFDITPLKSIKYTEGQQISGSQIPEFNAQFEGLSEKLQIINGKVHITDDVKKRLDKSYALSTINSYSETERISRLVGTVGDFRGKYFYNLNSSLFTDPLLIKVKKAEAPHTPLHLEQLIINKGKSTIANSRIIIEVEEGASFELIQSFYGQCTNNYLNNSVMEIILHKNAHMNHLILQEDTDEAFVFNNLFIKQLEGSEYNSQTLITGASISRNEYDISLTEKNCQCTVSSLFLGKGEQLHNSDVTIHHEAPDCTSRTITKAIGGGKSQGVFRGFVIVKPDAQKTDAVQQFKSILLNETSQINMEPHLEIWADDVKCSHGATVGQLDKDQLFYLQQRGFSPAEARKILLEAFAADITESISIEKVKFLLKERIYGLMDNLYE